MNVLLFFKSIFTIKIRNKWSFFSNPKLYLLKIKKGLFIRFSYLNKKKHLSLGVFKNIKPLNHLVNI